MAHFAELDDANTVIRVVVVGNDITTIDGVEDEQRGIDFLEGLFPESGTWKQTSYWTRGNVHYGEDGDPDGGTPMGYNYAGIGHTFDAEADAFHAPSPFPSWTLDEDYRWEPPTAMPDDGNEYGWDEATLSWVAT